MKQTLLVLLFVLSGTVASAAERPVKPEVHTLNRQLHDAGYLISMSGKNTHPRGARYERARESNCFFSQCRMNQKER